jgi:hypothetical protein
MKLDIGDKVQFVDRNRKLCAIETPMAYLFIPKSYFCAGGTLVRYRKKWWGLARDKKMALVRFRYDLKPSTPPKSFWVPTFLLTKYETLANHPLTKIFVPDER